MTISFQTEHLKYKNGSKDINLNDNNKTINNTSSSSPFVSIGDQRELMDMTECRRDMSRSKVRYPRKSKGENIT